MALVPSYPQPYVLYNPISGRPLYSGPNGEPGFASPPLEPHQLWTMPDGRVAYWHPGDASDNGNQVALGEAVTLFINDGIGYDGVFAAITRQGAPPDRADIMAAIAMAESGAHWGDHNLNYATGDDSIGLWQINLMAHPQYRPINLYNIDANAAAAADVSGRFTDFSPWTTYRNGAFRLFLRGSNQPTPGPAPSPAPPPPSASHGPIRTLVDNLIGQLPDPSIFGYHPRDSIQSIADGMADLLDAGIALIDAAWRAAVAAVDAAWRAGLRVVDAAWRLGVSAVDAAWRFTVGIVDAAWRLAVGALRDAIDFGLHLVDLAWRAGVAGVEALVHFLVGIVDAAWRVAVGALSDAVNFGIKLVDAAWRAGVAAVEASLHFLVGLVDAAWRAAVSIVDAAWREGLRVTESLLRDAIGLVDAAWRAFVHDVFDPLEREFRHWVDDVLGPIEPLLHALGQLGDWVIAAAKVAILGPVDVFDTVHELTPDDVLALFAAP
jgi:Lysozyme like domain